MSLTNITEFIPEELRPVLPTTSGYSTVGLNYKGEPIEEPLLIEEVRKVIVKNGLEQWQTELEEFGLYIFNHWLDYQSKKNLWHEAKTFLKEVKQVYSLKKRTGNSLLPDYGKLPMKYSWMRDQSNHYTKPYIEKIKPLKDFLHSRVRLQSEKAKVITFEFIEAIESNLKNHRTILTLEMAKKYLQ